MADLQGAQNALLAMSGPDVDVQVDNAAASVSVRKSDTTGPVPQTRSVRFDIAYDLDEGTYRITTIEGETHADGTGFGGSKTMTRGKSRSFSFSASVGADGVETFRFDTGPIRDEIERALESNGWTPKKGFLSKLFGG